MNIKKQALAMIAVAASATVFAAVPEVTGVTMTQASDRLVTITYTLSDAPAVVTVDVLTNVTGDTWASIGGEAVWNAMGDVWKRVETGSHTITWRPDHSWPDHKIADGGARAVVTAWALDNTPDYMVVDLAAAHSIFYYPGVDFLPGSSIGQKGAVTNNTSYKTSKLLMRKIMARGVTWTMGSADGEKLRNAAREEAHAVTLTNNYYIGVFEVTQAQWANVATNSTISANYTVDGAMRPMEKVCYNEIRLKANSNGGASASEIANYSWPKAPFPSSFLGLLRSKTGLDFDLPGEAQWEFAARAGHGSGFWGDGSVVKNNDTDANLNRLGRNERNGGRIYNGSSYGNPATSCGVTNGTAIVGSYAPNDWGLYDVHGNVWELCLDWISDDISEFGGRVNIDPESPALNLSGTSGTTRVMRGGSWFYGAGNCRPAARNSFSSPTSRGNDGGFRVVCTAGLR